MVDIHEKNIEGTFRKEENLKVLEMENKRRFLKWKSAKSRMKK
jgi:hypothetical protein